MNFACPARTKTCSVIKKNLAKMTEYRIQPVKKEDEDAIMDLLRRTFYIDEPMNKTIGLCDGGLDSCPELDEYCSHCLLEGLSFKAVDIEGNVVGVLISGVEPIKSTSGEELQAETNNCTNPKFKRILQVLTQREFGAKVWEQYPNYNSMVEIKVAATDNRWRRKGIMNALVAATEQAVKNKGYKLLRLDTSSYYSALSAEKMGFTCIYSISYSDIKVNGQTVVVPPAPHLHDKVYIKVLE